LSGRSFLTVETENRRWEPRVRGAREPRATPGSL
jgi:hypothetical protein